MEVSEIKLIKRAKRGDQQAFAEIVERYKDKLYNVAFRMLGNRQEAEDAVQEAFLRAYANLKTYDSSYKFTTWIYRIITNLSIDRLRKRKIDESLDAANDPDEISLYHTISSDELTPEEEIVRSETQDEVQSAILQLPPAYRATILLKYVHDRSVQEISEILRIPAATVKTRLHRGREALKGILEEIMGRSNSKQKIRKV
ncbi:RNA polymerase sigma factor SigW [Fodinisporobacter ferrooxydans]|uniref:RNA polymerase sigma factor SigW n=1 Tax=Fodinisporobacter ferrooxydans TaxID=2901836 RepID=A0ABY4CRV6_9BACL|nr:RNA polymerase sigma factor SigW [Alicyclobacillaceae bacterium MYW30-H2]